MPPPSTCTDCQGKLFEIDLLERGHLNSQVKGLHYTLPEAKRSFWTGLIPVAGEVRATMCEGCGRIHLHGVPHPPS